MTFFLNSVTTFSGAFDRNPGFQSNAPENVITDLKQKVIDTEKTLKALKQQILDLEKLAS